MQFKVPKDNDKYSWTKHAIEKMKFYGLSPQRVLQVLRRPNRCQQAVAPNCTACMQTLKNKAKSEIWMMYQEDKQPLPTPDGVPETPSKRKRIITAWRYPAVSPIQDEIPIPADILDTIENLIK